MKLSAEVEKAFRLAVEAVDAGNTASLQKLFAHHPQRTRIRFTDPASGYFSYPYLLWFIAGNPIRKSYQLVAVPEMTSMLLDAISSQASETFNEQINYALELVSTGTMLKQAGVQLTVMDQLINAGAQPGNGIKALANGNLQAAAHMLARGGELTLTAALCLDVETDLEALFSKAIDDDKITALAATALYGLADKIDWLLQRGVPVNTYPPPAFGFHSHASALHQAINAASLDTVKKLVAAGGDRSATDHVYRGTPRDWAQYIQEQTTEQDRKKLLREIAVFLEREP